MHIIISFHVCEDLIHIEKNGFMDKHCWFVQVEREQNEVHHTKFQAVIADLGLARPDTSSVTPAIVGTQGFMAPEIVKGQEFTKEADVSRIFTIYMLM